MTGQTQKLRFSREKGLSLGHDSMKKQRQLGGIILMLTLRRGRFTISWWKSGDNRVRWVPDLGLQVFDDEERVA